MFLHIPRAHEQGQICIYGFVSKIALGKSSCVSKIPPVKQKKLEDNRFRVRIHFATNRFTFEKIYPPPPSLHPKDWATTTETEKDDRYSIHLGFINYLSTRGKSGWKITKTNFTTGVSTRLP